MGVGIHKTRQDHLPGAIDLNDLPAILRQPGIAQRIFRFADRDNLSAETQYCPILDDAQFLKFAAAPRSGIRGRSLQCEKLADRSQQQCRLSLRVRFSGWAQAANSLAAYADRCPARRASLSGKIPGVQSNIVLNLDTLGIPL